MLDNMILYHIFLHVYRFSSGRCRNVCEMWVKCMFKVLILSPYYIYYIIIYHHIYTSYNILYCSI